MNTQAIPYRHVEVIVNSEPSRTIAIASDSEHIRLTVSLPFYQFLKWRINALVLDPDALTKRISEEVRRMLPRGGPLHYRVLVLNYPNEELREKLNDALAEAVQQVYADTDDARAAARDVAFGLLCTHFSADRVGSFITRVMNEDGMNGDDYQCYRILLSAGIHKVGAAMCADVDAACAANSADKINSLVRSQLCGCRSTWFWSSPWCIDRTTEFVLTGV